VAVDLLALAAQQGAVCGILDESVLERVFRVGRRAAPEDQFGAYQLIQSII
jgi:hypothetical protein